MIHGITHLCVFAALLSVSAPAMPPPTFANINYGPHERHKLDVWQSMATAPTPLVIFVHGGGWATRDKGDVLPKLYAHLILRGISIASINYRYTSIAILPAPVHDAARAVQFLRSKAHEWNLDAQHFAAYGVSAGGCSSLWLAYHDDLADPNSSDPVLRQSSRLQAAVGIAPQTSIDPEVVIPWAGDQVLNHPMITRAVGAQNRAEVKTRYAEWKALLQEFSPINHVTRDDPPVLLSYTTMGALPAPNAGAAIHHAIFGVKLKEKSDAVGATCVLRIEDQKPVALPTPEAFLIEHLKPKP